MKYAQVEKRRIPIPPDVYRKGYVNEGPHIYPGFRLSDGRARVWVGTPDRAFGPGNAWAHTFLLGLVGRRRHVACSAFGAV